MRIFRIVATAVIALALFPLSLPGASAEDFDVYTTPGTHHLNGREWRTNCEPYSQTQRCRTEIKATTVTEVGGRFVQKLDWVFNNLTYVAAPRSLWRGNPLGGNGQTGARVSWTENGRKWRTECDSALTGSHGCRSFITSSIVESRLSSSGNRSYHWVTKEVFNNMVRFTIPPPPGWLGRVDVASGPAPEVYGYYAGQPDRAHYATDPSGNFVIISRDGNNALGVDTFHPKTLRRIGTSRSISLKGWDEFGGVLAAPTGDFYVLVGRDNPQERSDIDVVAVRRYDSSWKLLGTALVKGDASQYFPGIRTPFRSAAPDMFLDGNKLIVHMSRLMFMGSDGRNHQSNLTIEVDTDTMKAHTFEALHGAYSTPYVSHSFNNFVTRAGGRLVFVDHGDAYPRSIAMNVFDDVEKASTEYDLMVMNGEIGDNTTGTTVTGVVSCGPDVLVVGNSIAHANAPVGAFTPRDMRNAFAITADVSTGVSRTTWLTSVSATGSDFVSEPRITEISENRFAVLFTTTRGTTVTTQYRLMDASAAVLASASFEGLPFPAGAAPIRIGSRLMWLGSSGTTVDVFGLDITNAARPTLARG